MQKLSKSSGRAFSVSVSLWRLRDTHGLPQSCRSGWILTYHTGYCDTVGSMLVSAYQVICRQQGETTGAVAVICTCPCLAGRLVSSCTVLHAAASLIFMWLWRCGRRGTSKLVDGKRGDETSGHGELTVSSSGQI